MKIIITGRKNMKNRKRIISLTLSFILLMGIFSSTAYADDYSAACWAYAYTTTNVYENVSMTGNTVGTISASEGVTVLSVHSNGNVYKIEYGSPSGPKQGYIYWNQVFVDGDNTTGGIITSSSSVYYYPGSSLTVGSVSTGEIVAILALTNNYYYIEYNVNTTVGRKRGYIPTSKATRTNPNKGLSTHWRENGTTPEYIEGGLGNAYSVYPLPRPCTANGSIASNEDFTILSNNININGTTYWLIKYEYLNTGEYKTGYIIP